MNGEIYLKGFYTPEQLLTYCDPKLLEGLKDIDVLHRTLTLLSNGSGVNAQSLEACEKIIQNLKVSGNR